MEKNNIIKIYFLIISLLTLILNSCYIYTQIEKDLFDLKDNQEIDLFNYLPRSADAVYITGQGDIGQDLITEIFKKYNLRISEYNNRMTQKIIAFDKGKQIFYCALKQNIADEGEKEIVINNFNDLVIKREINIKMKVRKLDDGTIYINADN